MARSKESYQITAYKSSVVKWTKAIENANEGKSICEVLNVNVDEWNQLSFKEQLDTIHLWKEDHPNFKLPKNKKSAIKIDYKSLAYQLIDETLSPEVREKVSKNLLKLKAYEDATRAYDEAIQAFNEAKSNLDIAKENLKKAKANLDKAVE